jgi:hypothetical protein
MGNNSSTTSGVASPRSLTGSGSSVKSLVPVKELKIKTGVMSSSIPFPLQSYESYEKLKLSSAFKEYLLQHIDHDDLVNSLFPNDLLENSNVALEGISSFLRLKPEETEALSKEMKNVENCSLAGIKQVRLSSTAISCFLFFIFPVSERTHSSN